MTFLHGAAIAFAAVMVLGFEPKNLTALMAGIVSLFALLLAVAYQ